LPLVLLKTGPKKSMRSTKPQRQKSTVTLAAILVLSSIAPTSATAKIPNAIITKIFTAPHVLPVPDGLGGVRACGAEVCMGSALFRFRERRVTHYYLFPKQCQARLDGALDLYRGEMYRREYAEKNMATDSVWGWFASGAGTAFILTMIGLYSR